jgi:chemotaxis signal transduction protein
VLLVDHLDERIGLLVDAVTLVRRITAQDFEQGPTLGEGIGTEHVVGIIRPDRKSQVTVIDIARILAESMQ